VQREAKQLKSHTNQNKAHTTKTKVQSKKIKNNIAKWSPRGEWLAFYAALL
jgi:ribosomal protein S17E